MRALVAASSPHGSTAEIARTLGDELSSQGIEVTVADPGDVGSLSDFDAVLLGSAVYGGHWERSAFQLAERVGTELPGRPVWLFSSGPVGDPSRKLVQQMGADPSDIPVLMERTGARAHQMFAGRLDRHVLHGLQRISLLAFRGLEGDFRDWTAIRRWADAIADELLAPSS